MHKTFIHGSGSPMGTMQHMHTFPAFCKAEVACSSTLAHCYCFKYHNRVYAHITSCTLLFFQLLHCSSLSNSTVERILVNATGYGSNINLHGHAQLKLGVLCFSLASIFDADAHPILGAYHTYSIPLLPSSLLWLETTSILLLTWICGALMLESFSSKPSAATAWVLVEVDTLY